MPLAGRGCPTPRLRSPESRHVRHEEARHGHHEKAGNVSLMLSCVKLRRSARNLRRGAGWRTCRRAGGPPDARPQCPHSAGGRPCTLRYAALVARKVERREHLAVSISSHALLVKDVSRMRFAGMPRSSMWYGTLHAPALSLAWHTPPSPPRLLPST